MLVKSKSIVLLPFGAMYVELPRSFAQYKPQSSGCFKSDKPLSVSTRQLKSPPMIIRFWFEQSSKQLSKSVVMRSKLVLGQK